MKAKRLPDTEFEIMDAIWDMDPPVTTPMIMEKIGKERGWKTQTLVSLFARLTERGFLQVGGHKQRYREFYPVISREEYLSYETDAFVNHYHKNSIVSLLTSLKGNDKLREAELAELDEWLKKQQKER